MVEQPRITDREGVVVRVEGMIVSVAFVVFASVELSATSDCDGSRRDSLVEKICCSNMQSKRSL